MSEKYHSVEHPEADIETHGLDGPVDEIRRTRVIQNSNSALRQFHYAEQWMDRVIGGKQFFETTDYYYY
jgi:hypothetical protein